MRGALLLLALAGCGGGPVLQNVPRPNPAVVAATAAAVAGAASLANPDAAGHKPESPNPANERRPIKSQMMPADVLDRLDAQQQKEADTPSH